METVTIRIDGVDVEAKVMTKRDAEVIEKAIAWREKAIVDRALERVRLQREIDAMELEVKKAEARFQREVIERSDLIIASRRNQA